MPATPRLAFPLPSSGGKPGARAPSLPERNQSLDRTPTDRVELLQYAEYA